MSVIKTRSELKFYIAADRIMNGLSAEISVATRLTWILTNSWSGVKEAYMRSLRCYSYYKQASGFLNRILRFYYGRMFRRLGMRLGYSIGEDVFGYGLVLPHYGNIVIGGTNRIGNYATIHTMTCITDSHSIIGDGFDCATGTVVSKKVLIGDSVSSCANSSIITDIGSNSLVAGSPAKVVKNDYPVWYERDGDRYKSRVAIVERFRDRNICQQ